MAASQASSPPLLVHRLQKNRVHSATDYATTCCAAASPSCPQFVRPCDCPTVHFDFLCAHCQADQLGGLRANHNTATAAHVAQFVKTIISDFRKKSMYHRRKIVLPPISRVESSSELPPLVRERRKVSSARTTWLEAITFSSSRRSATRTTAAALSLWDSSKWAPAVKAGLGLPRHLLVAVRTAS